MKKTADFLKSKIEVLVFGLIPLFVFYLAFILGGLAQEYFFISMEAVLFLLTIYLIFSFITYKKEESIREDNERLREELEERKAESISEQKELEDYFLLWVHQIKTPITASKLILQKELIKEREESLKIQLQYIETYTEMAINYLKLVRIGTDMDIVEVEIKKMVTSVLKRYSHNFFAKDLRLELGNLEGRVVSDSRWLSILFEQILSNALKYTETGSISISFQKEKRELVVEDSGIGIPSEDLPKIFDKGYSGLNGRLNQKSSGLGLFLGKKIADRLKIEILVESKLGEGCRFSLIFPE